jgi:hypothetical protein
MVAAIAISRAIRMYDHDFAQVLFFWVIVIGTCSLSRGESRKASASSSRSGFIVDVRLEAEE